MTYEDLVDHITGEDKRSASRIIREFLLSKGEEDETDFSAALSLMDIYDCQKCISNIAQVYVKGILPKKSERVFGIDEILSREEAELAAQKAADPSKRVRPAGIPSVCEFISSERAERLRMSQPEALFIDTGRISLSELNLNPFMLTPDIFRTIVLFGTNEYQLRFAGDILTRAGFKTVFLLKDTYLGLV